MKQNRFLMVFIAMVTLSLVFSACGSLLHFSKSTPTLDIPALQTQAAQTFIAELTQNAPTATSTPLPTNTPTETPTPINTPTETPTLIPTATKTLDVDAMARNNIRYYLVRDIPSSKKNDCQFQVIPFYTSQLKSGNISTDVTLALSALFSIKSATIGAFSNPLAASNFHVDSVTFNGGDVVVHLSGTLVKTGKACDNSRIHEQIWSTVRQFEDVHHTVIWLGGSLLGDRLANDK